MVSRADNNCNNVVWCIYRPSLCCSEVACTVLHREPIIGALFGSCTVLELVLFGAWLPLSTESGMHVVSLGANPQNCPQIVE